MNVKYLFLVFLLFSNLKLSFSQEPIPASANLFSTKTCPYGPAAAKAIYQIIDENPPDSLIFFEFHPATENSSFCNSPYSDTLFNDLQIPWVPTVVFNFMGYIGGGYDGSYRLYQTIMYERRKFKKFDNFGVKITVNHIINSDTIFAKIKGEYSENLSSNYFDKEWIIYSLLVEDNIFYNAPNGQNYFRNIVRDIHRFKVIPNIDSLKFNLAKRTFVIQDTFLIKDEYNRDNFFTWTISSCI